jgi:hypothetical protein
MPVDGRSALLTLLGRKGFSAATGLVGIRIDEFKVSTHQVFLEVQLRALKIDGALGVDNDFYAAKVMDLVVLADLFVEVDRIAEA